ncbi:MAG: hypothetical protein U1F00_15395 [Rhodoferax sp.]
MATDRPVWQPRPRPDPWAQRTPVAGVAVALLRPVGLLAVRCAPARTRPAAFEPLLPVALGVACPAAVGDIVPAGDGLLCVRTRPSELLVLAPGGGGGTLEALQQAADRWTAGLVSAVRVDDAWAVLQLRGPRVRGLLHRLADADSLPVQPGRASRLRCADLPATLLWRASQDYLLLVDAALADTLALWIDELAPALDSAGAPIRSLA